MTEHIKIGRKDGIVTLTFARPDKKNALTNAMYGVLADSLISAETDPAARVIIVSAHAAVEVFDQGRALGATACFDKVSFLRRIPQVLDKYGSAA